jgi:prepilin-type processing-associated H-X9-DG protein
MATQCLANMRQMGLAVQTYISESKGFLPPYQLTTGPTWAPMPYYFQYIPAFYQQGVPGVMICPSDNLVDAFTGSAMRGAYPRLKDQDRVDVYYSYAINRDLPKRITPYYLKPPIDKVEPEYFNPSTLTRVRTPSECAFLLETGSTAAISYATIYYGSFYYRFNHQGGRKMNVLMCDGHCEAKSASEILTADHGNVANTTAWPRGFRQFWFGQGDADGPVWYP